MSLIIIFYFQFQILQLVKQHKKEIIRIEFKISEEKFENKESKSENVQSIAAKENISFIKDSYLQYNRIDPNKRFDNFLTG